MEDFDDDFDLGEYASAYQSKAYKKSFSDDPDVWFAESRMSQTEVGLRFATWLLGSGLAEGSVTYLLAGYELTRRENPQFPVRRYLTERLGYTARYVGKSDWRGFYNKNGQDGYLAIDYEKGAGVVLAALKSGQRLMAFVTAGLLHNSRSPAEHKKFWQVVGRAVTHPRVVGTDLVAVCVPRSEKYRKLAAEYRKADGIIRSRIAVITVDRLGNVDGLQRLTQD